MRQRKTKRLKNYDYSNPGYYYITINTYGKIFLFGHVLECVIQNNHAGKMVKKWYKEIGSKFPNIKCHEFVIMPNHMHCIIEICCDVHPDGHVGPSLQNVLQWFKTMTTNNYIKLVKQNAAIPFNKRLWQLSYHDRIIRNTDELNRISEYIVTNPNRWNCKL